VTPKEHLSAAQQADVRDGIITYKIAAHAATSLRVTGRAAREQTRSVKARFRVPLENQFNLEPRPDNGRATSTTNHA